MGDHLGKTKVAAVVLGRPEGGAYPVVCVGPNAPVEWQGHYTVETALSFRWNIKPRSWLSVVIKNLRTLILKKNRGITPLSPSGPFLSWATNNLHPWIGYITLLSSPPIAGTLWLPSHHPGGCYTLVVVEEISPPIQCKPLWVSRNVTITNKPNLLTHSKRQSVVDQPRSGRPRTSTEEGTADMMLANIVCISPMYGDFWDTLYIT